MMKFALHTGLRQGEIFRLQWDHVDFEKGFVRVVAPKGGRTETIPLNETARGLLEGRSRGESPFCFPGRSGGQRVEAHKAANTIKRKAGLPKDFRAFHGLRHVYASTLASTGRVDMYTLQKLLTHKSPLMTQRYAHLRDEALRSASDLAGALLAAPQPEKKTIIALRDAKGKETP